MSAALYVLGCVMAHVANHMTQLVSHIKIGRVTHFIVVLFWPVVAAWVLFDSVWRVWVSE